MFGGDVTSLTNENTFQYFAFVAEEEDLLVVL